MARDDARAYAHALAAIGLAQVGEAEHPVPEAGQPEQMVSPVGITGYREKPSDGALCR
jgi:hypothetical protein